MSEDEWMDSFSEEENEIERMKAESQIAFHKKRIELGRLVTLYTYFESMADMKKKHVFYQDDNVKSLEKMLHVFIELEAYEKCAKIRDWMIEIQETKRLLTERKNGKSETITF